MADISGGLMAKVPKTDLLVLFETNPRSFRRHLAKDGLFTLLPIQGGDDYRNDDDIFIKILFRSVIDRAVLDIVGFPPKFNKLTQLQKYNKYERDAISWVSDLEDDSDFSFVCELADLDPNMVRKYIFKLKAVKDKLSKNGKVNIYKRKKA